MPYRFLRFPGGKCKAVTLSYDDGAPEDIPFLEIINRYGLKCTFNLNSRGLLAGKGISVQDAKDMLAAGHEVAVHGAEHLAEGLLSPLDGIREVLHCREELEQALGTIIRGMAYPDSGITCFGNTAQYENFTSTRIMLIFVMFLIVLVASVNISSALVMLAMERRREIAILKSVGATSEGIMAAFLLTGFCAGGAGVVLGIPLGILCAVNVNQILSGIEELLNIFVHFWYNLSNMFFDFLEMLLSMDFARSEFVPVQLLDPAFYLEEIPVILPWTGIFIIAAGTLVLSVVVSALPSIKAGKEKPLDTLRKF